MDTSNQWSGQAFHGLWAPLPEPCLLLTLKGRIVEINLAGARMLRRAAMEMIGAELSSFLADPADKLRQYLLLCSRTGQDIPGLLSFKDFDNRAERYRCFGHRIKTFRPDAALIFLRCQLARLANYRFRALRRQIAGLGALQGGACGQRAVRAQPEALQGIILPICCFCKKIRNEHDYYEEVEVYLRNHAGLDFSHTICPACMHTYYPEYNI